jgi:hypothetical protein
MPVQVIVPHPVAEKLFGIPASDAVGGGHCREKPFDSTVAWHVTLQDLVKQGKIFFVMTDIEKA